MPYTKQNWIDGAAGATPVSAARLNYMEQGIFDAYDPPATDTVAGLVKLTYGLGGTSDKPTTPMVGHVAGGSMAAQGQWIAPGFAGSTALLVDGITGGMVVHIGRDCTVDKLAVNITSAGTSGSVIRLGIYRITYNTVGVPVATLLYDAGTVAGTAITVAERTLAAPLAVEAGSTLWLTATGQGTPGTQPIIATGSQGAVGLPWATATAALGTLGGLQATGNPGALPTTPTIAAVAANTPRIALHTSA